MDQVAQIREKIDIVSLLSEYITIKKAGKNFQALCPFHGEKTPSFHISQERQLWHCFGCGKGGDIYTFLMEYERLEFPEALKILAKRAGIELISQSYADTATSAKKEALYKINALASEYYHFILTKHAAGNHALQYVKQRGLTDKVIETFKLGFAPAGGSDLTKYLLRRKQCKKEDVVDAGLALQGRYDVIDFFRGRLMFPLIDHHDNTVGFSGRVVDGIPANGGKYINTRDTLVYHKREQMYGLHVTKEAIKKQNQVLLVEGEVDVISCFQHGISNVVAVKGTALTEQQVRLLSRYAEKITFCFDGDTAGQEAIKRSLSVVAKRGIATTVVVIPSGKDPDESLRTNPVLFKEAVRRDSNIYDYLFEQTAQKYDTNSSEGKQRFAEEVLPFINEIENAIVREHYINKLSNAIHSSSESIIKELERLRKKLPIPAKEPSDLKQKSREEKLEEYLLALILQDTTPEKHFASSWQKLQPFMAKQRASQKLFYVLAGFYENMKDGARDTLQSYIPTELLAPYNIALLLPLPAFENDEKLHVEVEKTATQLREMYIKEKIKQITEELKEKEIEKDEENTQKLKEVYSQLIGLLKSG